MKRIVALLGLTLVMSVGLAGCAAEPPGIPQPPDLTLPTPTPDAPPEESPEMPLPPDANVPPELFQQAAEEAAAIAGVGVADLEIVHAEAVTWNDGSLGCPEPGMMYTQALVDGYWIVFRHGGQEFDFRADQRGDTRLCPPGQGHPPINP
jgi:hypothetical protein